MYLKKHARGLQGKVCVRKKKVVFQKRRYVLIIQNLVSPLESPRNK